MVKLGDPAHSSKAWHRYLENRLQEVYESGEASALAFEVMRWVGGLSRTAVLADERLSVEEHLLESTLEKLLKEEPVQYVTGKAEFYGLTLHVDPRVLIPRPETEELVQWIVQREKSRGGRIMDVGTGSGCIAIALAALLEKAEVWGADYSEEILDLARQNAELNNVEVQWRILDILDSEGIHDVPVCDVLVSNPPYVPEKDKAVMHSNVLDYEPSGALFVPDEDPLVHYRALLQLGLQVLGQDGWLYAEIHENYADQLAELFSGYGYTNVEVRKDMNGKDRMIRGVLPQAR